MSVGDGVEGSRRTLYIRKWMGLFFVSSFIDDFIELINFRIIMRNQATRTALKTNIEFSGVESMTSLKPQVFYNYCCFVWVGITFEMGSNRK